MYERTREEQHVQFANDYSEVRIRAFGSNDEYKPGTKIRDTEKTDTVKGLPD